MIIRSTSPFFRLNKKDIKIVAYEPRPIIKTADSSNVTPQIITGDRIGTRVNKAKKPSKIIGKCLNHEMYFLSRMTNVGDSDKFFFPKEH